MFFQKRTNDDPDRFWKEYGERHGEKVLAYALGQYLSGWDEYPMAFWGLLIATDGGFRVHHFPHESWLQALSRTTMGGEMPREKTIFIPRDRIVSAEFKTEPSLWRRIFFAAPPRLLVRYRKEDGTEEELTAETEGKGESVAQYLAKAE
jgi:hypothetical protein